MSESRSPPAPAISVSHLWHTYEDVPVLSDVSFEVAKGEIFGFIGPNGAGKTTTIRILATLLEPSAGRVEIEGLDVTIDPARVRRLVGYMPDHAGVYERITVVEYLEFFAAACGVPASEVVDAVIELTDLTDLSDRLVRSLSKGMRQRLGLARVLLHDPQVLIMDEPASDLDPRARVEIRDLVLELKELGKTIFLSSHILSELSDICTSVAIIEKGRLLVSGPIAELSARLDERRAALVPSEPHAEGAGRRRLRVQVLGDPHAAVAPAIAHPAVLHAEVTDRGTLSIEHAGDDPVIAEIVAALVEAGAGVVAVEPERPELERIFLEVTEGKPR